MEAESVSTYRLAAASKRQNHSEYIWTATVWPGLLPPLLPMVVVVVNLLVRESTAREVVVGSTVVAAWEV